MTKNEIVNYVVETPHNVNKRILGQQLDELQKNVSWNDLRDKPFYEETEIVPYPLCDNIPTEFSGDHYYVYNSFEWSVFESMDGRRVSLTIEGGDLPTSITGSGTLISEKNNSSDYVLVHQVDFDEDVPHIIKCEIKVFDYGTIDVEVDTDVRCNVTVALPDTMVEKTVVHKLDAKYLPGGGGGHWVLLDNIDGHTVVTASDGIFEALSEFLGNGVCTNVAVYWRNLVDGEVRIMSFFVEEFSWNDYQIMLQTYRDGDHGLIIYINSNGRHDYYYE